MKLAVYIPTEGEHEPITQNYNIAYARAQVKAYIKRTFADCYGGYTVLEAVGGWMGEEGLVEESVEIIYTFTDSPDLAQLRAMGRMVCNRLGEEAATIEHSGEMEIVTVPDMEVAGR